MTGLRKKFKIKSSKLKKADFELLILNFEFLEDGIPQD
jgi:hypothetical protein